MGSAGGWQGCFDDCLGSVVVLLCISVHLGCVVLCWRLGSGGNGIGHLGEVWEG